MLEKRVESSFGLGSRVCYKLIKSLCIIGTKKTFYPYALNRFMNSGEKIILKYQGSCWWYCFHRKAEGNINLGLLKLTRARFYLQMINNELIKFIKIIYYGKSHA